MTIEVIKKDGKIVRTENARICRNGGRRAMIIEVIKKTGERVRIEKARKIYETGKRILVKVDESNVEMYFKEDVERIEIEVEEQC